MPKRLRGDLAYAGEWCSDVPATDCEFDVDTIIALAAAEECRAGTVSLYDAFSDVDTDAATFTTVTATAAAGVQPADVFGTVARAAAAATATSATKGSNSRKKVAAGHSGLTNAAPKRRDIRARRWRKARTVAFDGDGIRDNPLIQNLVYKAELGVHISLTHVAKCCRFTEYNPRRFAHAMIRFCEPVTTVLLFATGKAIITGCKSDYDASVSLSHIVKLLKRIGIYARYSRILLCNIVSNTYLGFSVDLNYLKVALPGIKKYEPELFPGLIWTPPHGGLSMLIFTSGKVVITGVITMEALANAAKHVLSLVQVAQNKPTSGVHQHSKRVHVDALYLKNVEAIANMNL